MSGHRYGRQRNAPQLVQAVKEKRGATICKDLKGIKADTVLCPCPECVRNAELALGAGWAVENMKQACRKQPF